MMSQAVFISAAGIVISSCHLQVNDHHKQKPQPPLELFFAAIIPLVSILL